MKFPESKFNIGDVVIVKPSKADQLLVYSAFTIVGIMAEKKSYHNEIEILYTMAETRWMISEQDVIRKVTL